MDKSYCRIVDGGKRIEYAQSFVELDGRIWINPTAEQYARAGWLENAQNAPEAREGCVARVERYEAREGLIFAVYAYDAITPPPRVFSKLYLILALEKRGKYRAFVELLEGANMMHLWNAANELNESYPDWANYREAAAQYLNLTDAEVEAILGEAVVR